MDNLVVLNNEKISKKENKFYCRNFNSMVLPEGLNNFFNVQYIARRSKSRKTINSIYKVSKLHQI